MNPEEFAESQEPTGRRVPLEFESQDGLILRELVDWDVRDLLEFINNNRDAEFVPQLKDVQTEFDALMMITNPKTVIFGTQKERDGPIVALTMLSKEEEQDGQKDPEHMLSMGGIVDKNFRRQGIRSASINTVVANAAAIGARFFEMPEVRTIRSYVRPDNRASRKVLEKCGFHLQGGRPHVHVFYDLDEPGKQA